MKKYILWCFCCASVDTAALENTVELEQPQAGTHTIHNTQVVENEIGEYTELLAGILTGRLSRAFAPN